MNSPLPLLEPFDRYGAAAAPARSTEHAINAAPVKVIYIAGYGRSGTTLLDIALGEHPSITGAGELSTLARHVWAEAEYCACGSVVRDCPFWRDVVDDWRAGEAPDMIDDYHAHQRRTETILPLGRLRAGNRQNARTTRLFASIRAHSGRPIVLDSSKLPGRGAALAANPGIDLYVIHVVRDPRGVAWSLRKGIARHVEGGVQRTLRPKSLLHTALRWSIVNAAADALCRRVGNARSLRVRYEDFVAYPRETLGRILGLVGEQPLAAHDGGRAATFRPQHQMAGSRHRMQPAITIERDERWRDAMPPAQQALVSAITAPLRWRYGYGDAASGPRGAA